MKGVVFNVVEEVVDETLPPSTWDRVLDRAHLDGVYTSLGNYPDADLSAIVDGVCAHTGMGSGEVLHHVGLHGYRHLTDRHPELVEEVADLGSLLHHLEDVIHPEVRKLLPDAAPPAFTVRDLGPGTWEVEYRSPRQLCHLAAGLIAGAATQFGTPCRIEQPTCTLEGGDHCCLVVSLEP
jgi:hypothetical protein